MGALKFIMEKNAGTQRHAGISVLIRALYTTTYLCRGVRHNVHPAFLYTRHSRATLPQDGWSGHWQQSAAH